MKKALFLVVILMPLFLRAQNPVQPTLGDGSEGNPYQISTLDHLAWFSDPANSGAWDKHYVQTANIDASATLTWNGGDGFDPIGVFWGHYDGNYFVISGLTIDRAGEDYVAFFSAISGGTVSKMVLQNVNIQGTRYVAAIAGRSYAGSTVTQCSVSGSISGFNHISGLVDYNQGTISQCVSHCNATSSASGWVGGLSAYSSGSIDNSYSTGEVRLTSATGGECGGLIGGLNGVGSVTYCYSKGQVSFGTNINGGLINIDYGGTCDFNYWNITTSGQTGSACGTGLTDVAMGDAANFAGWDFESIWVMSGAKDNGPILQWEPNIGGGGGATATPLSSTYFLLLALLFFGGFGLRRFFFSR